MTIDPTLDLPTPREPMGTRLPGRSPEAAERRGTMPCGRGVARCVGPE